MGYKKLVVNKVIESKLVTEFLMIGEEDTILDLLNSLNNKSMELGLNDSIWYDAYDCKL